MIELSACGPSTADLRCGVFTVQEDREAPNGRTIDLAIAVAPARSRTPARDPVFIIAGGPGQGAADVAPWIVHRFEAIRVTRDLVFVDVRGTGSSAPLACDFEHLDELPYLLGGNVDLDALDDCLASYGGADLQQYTTANIVDDLDEVRDALGYEQVNLFGISYGTVVAQQWIRRHGEQVRSAVLDGVVPLDANVSLLASGHNERVLERVLADCREQVDCAAAFPGLERKLALTLAELDSNRALEQLDDPRSGAPTRVDITSAGFLATLSAALYRPDLTSLIPLVIERAHAGDFGPLSAVALRSIANYDSISMGLYLSVACAEQFGHIDPRAREAAFAGLDTFNSHNFEVLEQACARWPHATLGPEAATPLQADTPVLILSGTYDPVTPPSFGEQLLAGLGNARHLEVEAGSHGIWYLGCTPRLLANFFDDPNPQALDATCLDTLARPAPFLTANGPLPAPTPEFDETAVATEVGKL